MSRIYYDPRDYGDDFTLHMQLTEFLLNHGMTAVPMHAACKNTPEGTKVVRVIADRICIVNIIIDPCDATKRKYEYIYVDPNPIEWTIPSEWCGTRPNPNPFDMTKHRLPLLEPIVQGLVIDMSRDTIK
jgi:hypothetical protein